MTGNGHHRRRRQQRNSSSSEILERRALLSCSGVVLDSGSGTAYVTGTTGNDVVGVSVSEFDENGNTGASDFVHVDINGCLDVFADTDVSLIDFDGDAGDDEFTNDTSIPSIARGAAGSDTLFGGQGDDTLQGGGDHDRIEGFGGADSIGGGSGNDTLHGNGGADTIDAGAGSDRIKGHSDADYLDGGAGTDTVEGGDGHDELLGGVGDDLLKGGDGSDILTGEDHNDTLEGGAGGDTISGGLGDDLIDGEQDPDLIHGGDGLNTLVGGDGPDTITGGGRSDSIEGGAGNDVIDTGEGDNTVYGGSGADTIEGGEGDDRIYGGTQADLVDGEGGNDLIYGQAGADLLDGDEGNDTLFGGGGADDLFGGEGDDSLNGGAGDDGLLGAEDADTMKGGSGDDRFTHKGEDNIIDLRSRDAEMLFIDDTGETTLYDYDGDGTDDTIDWTAGTWDYEEIAEIDFLAQRTMQREIGDNSLLQGPATSLTFYRVGAPTVGGATIDPTSVPLSWNDGTGRVWFQDEPFGVEWFHQHFLHEVAHVWQDDSGDVNTWMSLSDWQLGSVVTGSRVLSGDGEWTYDPTLNTTLFVRHHGMHNPENDFATVFAAYFMDVNGEDYNGVGATSIDDVEVSGVYDKLDYLNDFLSSL